MSSLLSTGNLHNFRSSDTETKQDAIKNSGSIDCYDGTIKGTVGNILDVIWAFNIRTLNQCDVPVTRIQDLTSVLTFRGPDRISFSRVTRCMSDDPVLMLVVGVALRSFLARQLSLLCLVGSQPTVVCVQFGWAVLIASAVIDRSINVYSSVYTPHWDQKRVLQRLVCYSKLCFQQNPWSLLMDSTTIFGT